jgi:hypothetical protein
MTSVHSALRRLFALLLDPLAPLGPAWSLIIVSALSGVVLLYAFRWTSNPPAIAAARKRAQAHLLAVRLYRHDLPVVFRSQAQFLSALGAYLARMIVPFLAVALPFSVLFAHLDARYAYRAAHPGEATVITATADDVGGWRLEAPEGVRVEAGPVRMRQRRQISWRVRPLREGRFDLAVAGGGRRIEKGLAVSRGDVGAPPRRMSAGLEALFAAPAEPAIEAAAGVTEIEVEYPSLGVTGLDLHWLVVFLVVSTVAALALKRRAGVEF